MFSLWILILCISGLKNLRNIELRFYSVFLTYFPQPELQSYVEARGLPTNIMSL
jgi:hypothetical protein